MKFGISTFVTDEGIAPGALARGIEERGFDSLFIAEHTHIPLSRKSPWPRGGELPRRYYSNSTISARLSQISADEVRRRANGWIMQFLQVLRLIVPAKVRTSHGPTTEEILQAYCEGPNASTREEPKAPATTTQRLAAADIRTSVVPLGSQFLSVGLRAIGQGYDDCVRGSPNLCETTATSGTRTSPSRRGAALRAPRHLPVSRRDPWGDGLRSLFWRDGLTQR